MAYRIRQSSRAKALRISVSTDGEVIVTKPKRVSLKTVELIIQKRLGWITDTLKKFKDLAHTSPSLAQYGQYNRQSKSQALALVTSRIEHFNAFYGLPIRRISIRNQRTRWGSCSRRGNLNFNYRIIHLPTDVADYLVVHELCHIAELNHSASFWSLVARSIENYRELRSLLRKTRM